MLNSLSLFEPFSSSLSRVFNSFGDWWKNDTTEWKITKGGYKMTLPLTEGLDAEDIKVTLDEEKYLKVSYQKETKNQSIKYNLEETLPDDAISDTVDAKFEDGNLVITVDREVENEEEVENSTLRKITVKK